MTPLPFDEGYVEAHTSAKVYPRGLDYVAAGRVVDLVRRGDVLSARVVGTDWAPYEVQVRLDEGNVSEPVAEVRCTCPYEWGGWCKHVVAAVLEALAVPETVDERPALAETLAGLKRPELIALLEGLVAEHPALTDAIETLAGLPPREPRSDEWDDEGW